MQGEAVEPGRTCDHCRQRPAAYVLDRLERIGRALSGQHSPTLFPAWACETCVQEVLDQALDVVSIASVCRVDSYRP